MNYPDFFFSRNSLSLFGFSEHFNFLSNLYLKKNLPKVIMFTGNKGSGKSTLVNHFLYSVFDAENYDIYLDYFDKYADLLTKNSFKNLTKDIITL